MTVQTLVNGRELDEHTEFLRRIAQIQIRCLLQRRQDKIVQDVYIKEILGRYNHV